MKVVLFCGGLGLRARDGADSPPKPLQQVGGQPVLWHLMRWYAEWGHREFVLCLGHGGARIVDWLLSLAGVAVAEPAGPGRQRVRVLSGDFAGCTVLLAHTGLDASIGMRLRAVRDVVQDEPLFLANYADVLCDVPLDEHVALAERSGAAATFLAVRPNQSFHVVEVGTGGWVRAVVPAARTEQWINGGFFVLRPSVFDVLHPGEELVEQPFARLIAAGALLAHRYDGFWVPVDTVKDRHRLEQMWSRGERPWAVWAAGAPARVGTAASGS